VPIAATDTTDALPPLEQTTRALNATITAVAERELTAQAQTEAQAQQGTVTALRATEESMNATAVALAVAQTAQAAPTSGSFAPPGSVPGDVCDRATVIGSISELAIQETTQMNNIFTLASAPWGATVDVLCTPLQTDDGRVWARVRYAGYEGWMSTRYLRFQGGLPVEQCRSGTVVNVTALSIREETNRESRMLGEVPAGQQVAVLCVPEIFDDGRSWVFVRYGSIEGWMSTNFLDIR
jgi:Bacterial SH3 domain.